MNDSRHSKRSGYKLKWDVAISYCIAKANKNEPRYSVRFFISWFATGLVTMQGIVCTLRVPLHAVQLAQRFASKLARLCYYARFARYKSCCPHHLCSTKKLQKTKSTRFLGLVLFCYHILWFAPFSEYLNSGAAF